MDADLSALLVKQKWYLGTQHGECYDLLIERLKHLDKVISPLQKMQCTGSYAGDFSVLLLRRECWRQSESFFLDN